jgi:beta-glucanase (GH16 family)
MGRVLRRLPVAVVGAAVVVGAWQSLPSGAKVRAERSAAHGRLVWHDEFNGRAGSQPAPRKWEVLGGTASHNELEDYTKSKANVSLDGHGHLAIIARRQTTFANGRTWQFTSGKLDTLGRFQIKYGLIEARIKVPAGVGLWPLFWMLGSDYPRLGWPGAGEIDIMEMQGQHPHALLATIHGPGGSKSRGWQLQRHYLGPVALNKAFHVYAINWTPNKVVWSVDGHPYGTITRGDLSPGRSWVFNQPFYLLLNLSVGGHFVGPPNSSTRFPATMLVDWVRVYS